jgi:hypothetical protein
VPLGRRVPTSIRAGPSCPAAITSAQTWAVTRDRNAPAQKPIVAMQKWDEPASNRLRQDPHLHAEVPLPLVPQLLAGSC